ncbi:uncharacterized protein [Nicotiana sylvestris]|uniref:uncharacterized protein n=1 Tax=Nicotiana sylvestris TaxID=4096 RepID=UPI00388C59EB
MTGLSTSIVAHKLPANPMCPPVMQKIRKFKPDMSLKIKEEVTKQIKAKVLRVVEYPTWLANIMPVPKKDGKEYLSTPPVLVQPEHGRPLLLYLFVLDGAFGCALGQHDEMGKEGKPYTIRMMDPLKYIFQKPMPTGNVAKWKIMLSEFCIVYVTQKAAKIQALADHLAENPVGGEYEPLKMYFPDEEVSFVGEDITETYDSLRIFFNGAANFKGVGIGAILVSETSQHFPVDAKIRFSCTNNMAEYESCILGLNWAVDMNIQEILRFTKIELKYVPRIQNEFVDALATLSSIIQHLDKNLIDPIPVRIHNQPAYYAHVEEETDGNPWFHDIKEYLAKGEYPKHANHTQKCTL